LILSGGSADELLPLLNRPVRLVDNLVLDGLVIIAREGIAG
jgi:pantothenate kinase type III